jgi:hypothetical protein
MIVLGARHFGGGYSACSGAVFFSSSPREAGGGVRAADGGVMGHR